MPCHGAQSHPLFLPLVGNLLQLLLSRFSDLPHRALRELSKAYGPLMLLRLGAVPTLVVSSAEAAREVMKTHDLAFCSRHVSTTIGILSCSGQGIVFSPYNERWREMRKLCALELFSQRRMLSFRSIREEEVGRLISSVLGDCAAGRPVNLSEKISCTLSDTIVRMAIGSRCSYRDEFLHEVDEAVRLTGGFNLADLFSAAARDMARCRSNINRIIGCIIKEQREEDLLAVLLRLQKDGGLQFPLTNEILSTRDVIDYTRMGDVGAHEESKNIAEESLPKLSYVHLVIKEALRLHPPGPFLIPREWRDNKYWDDAEEFKPESTYRLGLVGEYAPAWHLV
ncbi:hypothetical protein HU200_008675 [Digitaria exilis]|uniref:Cytochrome P450 n=1 Tax=Digitaria exilis TaxID=1010633 RepID=A0A835KTC8_9POAL|nr:hypothetical protein HU200_008675 [Digitaria exilis]